MEVDNLIENLSSNLDRSLKCAICLDIFREPTILPCGHTFCYSCITDFDTYQMGKAPPCMEKRKMKVICPLCRDEIPGESLRTKSNGVRTNYALDHLIKCLLEEIPTGQQQSNKKKYVDAAVNTETLAFTEERFHFLDKELDDVFNLTQMKKSRLVVDCLKEIDEIRRDYQEKASFSKQNPNKYGLSRQRQCDVVSYDPAILSVGGSPREIPRYTRGGSRGGMSGMDLIAQFGH